MAKLDIKTYDITLAEVDKALEKKKNDEGPRHYLGMSQIGEECYRKLFYSFRNAEKQTWKAAGVRRIEDGHVQEDIMAERLRMVPGITLTTHTETGSQIGFTLLLDHFRGHCDGVILGILEAPGTWHVWEHKSVNEDSFNKLKKMREEKGEKQALKEWNIIYYAQAQIYMHKAELTRHYLTVSTPGGRDYLSIRTEYNRKEAEFIIEKAKGIIFDNVLPERISESREFFKCKWCEFQEICHDGKFPLVNCKTCGHSEPVEGGVRRCNLFGNIIPDDFLHVGCDEHVYNHTLVAAKLLQHIPDGNIYETTIKKKKLIFANMTLTGVPDVKHTIDAIHTSKSLREKVQFVSNLSAETIMDGSEVVPDGAKQWEKANKIDSRLKGL